MSGHRPAGSADLLRAYLALDSSAVSDALDGVGLPPGVGGLGPMWAGARMAGFAVTVELGPRASARGAGAHILTTAVATATEHDVIVVANGGRTDVSGWGGLLSLGASRRGLRGAVVDGACRDIGQARELRFPVYARGLVPVTARGRLQQRSSGGTVRIGGVPVDQGDVVLADETGVVFVPRGRVEEVLAAARAIEAREAAIARELRAGASLPEVMRDARLAGATERAPNGTRGNPG
jgi:regulator of RNase E activity RraA